MAIKRIENEEWKRRRRKEKFTREEFTFFFFLEDVPADIIRIRTEREREREILNKEFFVFQF